MTIEEAVRSNSLTAEHIARLKERARFVRTETVRLISIAKVGHYSSTFSCAEIFAVLYYDILRLRRGEPSWPERDRFLMGKGHAAVGLYPLLADWGFFPATLLDGYCQLGNPLGDHPDMRLVPGADFSSGSIGHALSAGLGMALGGRIQKRSFDVYALLGDGEMQEGQNWEAFMSAPKWKLDNLVMILDHNNGQIDGFVDQVMDIEPLGDKLRAFNWNVQMVDGHDLAAVEKALANAQAANGKPHAIIAKTIKGKGVSFMENNIAWHGNAPKKEDADKAVKEILNG